MTEQKSLRDTLKKVQKNHPDCIPVFFLKHPESTAQMKKPTHPMVLFKKQMKIEQIMIHLYQQIQYKGLYFFCPYLVTKTKKNRNGQEKVTEEIRYYPLQQGPTIQEIYGKFGKGGYLTVVYGDKNLGMGGLLKFQKWMCRAFIVVGIIWLVLIFMNYYYIPNYVHQPQQQNIFDNDIL